MRVEQVLVQNVHPNASALIPTPDLHYDVGTAEHQALLATLQFASQVPFRNGAGVLPA